MIRYMIILLNLRIVAVNIDLYVPMFVTSSLLLDSHRRNFKKDLGSVSG